MGNFLHTFSPEEKKQHVLVLIAHKIAGKLLCAVAFVQMWLGFDLLEVNTLLRGLWGAWLAVVTVAFVAAELKKNAATAEPPEVTQDSVEKRQENPLQDDQEDNE